MEILDLCVGGYGRLLMGIGNGNGNEGGRLFIDGYVEVET